MRAYVCESAWRVCVCNLRSPHKVTEVQLARGASIQRGEKRGWRPLQSEVLGALRMRERSSGHRSGI